MYGIYVQSVSLTRSSSQLSATADSDVDGQAKPDQTSGSRTDPDSPASQDGMLYDCQAVTAD